MSDLYVLVEVAGERYALPVDRVLEVAAYGNVVPFPGAPDAVLGVRNLRGNVLTVLDLPAMLGIQRTRVPRRLTVVEHDGDLAGLAVDSVLGVEHLPNASEEVDSPYLLGGVLTSGFLVGVIDVCLVLESVQAVPVTP